MRSLIFSLCLLVPALASNHPEPPSHQSRPSLDDRLDTIPSEIFKTIQKIPAQAKVFIGAPLTLLGRMIQISQDDPGHLFIAYFMMTLGISLSTWGTKEICWR